jgi:hypothetical protein
MEITFHFGATLLRLIPFCSEELTNNGMQHDYTVLE